MPIPELNENGLLPDGLHRCTFDELKECFGQEFGRRKQLIGEFEQYLEELRSSEIVTSVIIDGSFVTQKSQPSDIDMVLVLPEDHDLKGSVRPFEYNLLVLK